MPSITGSGWTEMDANLRAAQYFRENEGFEWDRNFYAIGSKARKYSELADKKTHAAWWEYPIGIMHPWALWWINSRTGKH